VSVDANNAATNNGSGVPCILQGDFLPLHGNVLSNCELCGTGIFLVYFSMAANYWWFSLCFLVFEVRYQPLLPSKCHFATNELLPWAPVSLPEQKHSLHQTIPLGLSDLCMGPATCQRNNPPWRAGMPHGRVLLFSWTYD